MTSECCICLDAKCDLEFRPCKHQSVCADCYLKDKINACPICRTEIQHLFSGETVETIINTMCKEDSNLLYECLTTYINNISVIDLGKTGPIWETIYELFQNVGACNENANKYCLLTVLQTETILQYCLDKGLFEVRENYVLRNIFVAMCKHPWNVDMRLGSHGVCYHGNLGDKPSIIEGINLIKRNVKFLLEKKAQS